MCTLNALIQANQRMTKPLVRPIATQCILCVIIHGCMPCTLHIEKNGVCKKDGSSRSSAQSQSGHPLMVGCGLTLKLNEAISPAAAHPFACQGTVMDVA